MEMNSSQIRYKSNPFFGGLSMMIIAHLVSILATLLMKTSEE